MQKSFVVVRLGKGHVFGPGGILAVYMMGAKGSDVLFWVENLHPWYFFGVKRSVTYILGLKVCLIE